jgi:hypothetical protein
MFGPCNRYTVRCKVNFDPKMRPIILLFIFSRSYCCGMLFLLLLLYTDSGVHSSFRYVPCGTADSFLGMEVTVLSNVPNIMKKWFPNDKSLSSYIDDFFN